MSTTQVTASCDRCGADGPLDEHDYCASCAAETNGYDAGRRMQALLAVAVAVDAARDSDQCSPEMVRAIVEDTLTGGGYSETAAIELAEAAA